MTTVSGYGNSLSYIGSNYNFTKMTNAQFSAAVDQLESEGKISQPAADQLSAIAQGVDSVPISGPSLSVSQILSDPTEHNFLAEIQGDDASANIPGAVGGALCDEMLEALLSNQGAAISKSA